MVSYSFINGVLIVVAIGAILFMLFSVNTPSINFKKWDFFNTNVFYLKTYWIVLGIISFAVWVNYATNNNIYPIEEGNDCSSNYKKCLDNADMANHYSEWFRVRYACKDKFSELVKYGTPEYKLGDSYAFSSFLVGDDYPKKGIATLIAKVALPNEFGTKVNGKQACEFDLDTNKVIKQYGDFNNVNGYYVSDDYEAIIKSREQQVQINENLPVQSSQNDTQTSQPLIINNLKGDGKPKQLICDSSTDNMELIVKEAGTGDWSRYTQDFVYYLCSGNMKDANQEVLAGNVKAEDAINIAKALGKEFTQ